MIDISLRVPAFAAGVAALGWAGANMTVATSAVAATVSGRKLIPSIGRKLIPSLGKKAAMPKPKQPTRS